MSVEQAIGFGITIENGFFGKTRYDAISEKL